MIQYLSYVGSKPTKGIDNHRGGFHEFPVNEIVDVVHLGMDQRQATELLRTGLFRLHDGPGEKSETFKEKDYTGSEVSGLVLNVLTRTSDRPNRFKRCRESVLAQKWGGTIRHIVSIDRPNTYVEADVVVPAKGMIRPPVPNEQRNHKKAPYNLYCNDLLEAVRGGWIIFLDDDDEFLTEDSVASLEPYMTDAKRLLICKFSMGMGNASIVMPRAFGRELVMNDLPCTSAVFHADFKRLGLWHGQYAGDFTAIQNLEKALKVEWVDSIVAGTQEGPSIGGQDKKRYSAWTPRKVENPKTPQTFLSIVMPVMNQVKYTKATLKQLREVLHTPHEIIVIDNGSTDETQTLLENAGIKLIRNNDNAGISESWNQGCELATGTHIAIINNDLLLPDGIFETLLSHNKDAICPLYEQGEEPRKDFVAHNKALRKKKKTTRKTDEPGRFPQGFSGFIFMLSREAWERTGPFDTTFFLWFSDTDYWQRLKGMGFQPYQSMNCLIHHYQSKTLNTLPDIETKIREERYRYRKKWEL